MRDNIITLPPRHDVAVEPFGSSDRDAFDAKAIIGFVRRSWRLCLIWLGVGLCAGIAFMLVAPAYYTADSTIIFYDSASRPNGGTVDTVAPAFVDTQIQILQSADVLGRVVDQNGLIRDREFGESSATGPEARYAAILRVAHALSVYRIGTSDTVRVALTAKDRVRSAAMTNAIVQAYLEWRSDLRRSDKDEATSELRERLADVRAKAFSSALPVAPSSATAQSAEEARTQFREQQDSREAFRAMYNSLLQRSTSPSESSPIHVRVLTTAEPAFGHSSPRLIFVFGIVIAAAGAVGIGHAFFREATRPSLKTPEDVQRFTGLDWVAGVPTIERRAWLAGEDEPPAYQSAPAGLSLAMVRLAVRLARRKGRRRRRFVIGVAAPTGAVGTSAVSAHLAGTFARCGHKTLLVDANWQEPSNGFVLPTASPAPMAANELACVAPTAANELACIYSRQGKLDVLVLRARASLSPLTASASILTALKEVREKYECVVVDFHSPNHTVDLEASAAVVNRLVAVVDVGQATPESLNGFLAAVPREKIEGALVYTDAVDAPGMSEEFARFVGPVVRAFRAAATAMPPLRASLAAGLTRSLPWANRFGAWLDSTFTRCVSLLVRAFHAAATLMPALRASLAAGLTRSPHWLDRFKAWLLRTTSRERTKLRVVDPRKS